MLQLLHCFKERLGLQLCGFHYLLRLWVWVYWLLRRPMFAWSFSRKIRWVKNVTLSLNFKLKFAGHKRPQWVTRRLTFSCSKNSIILLDALNARQHGRNRHELQHTTYSSSLTLTLKFLPSSQQPLRIADVSSSFLGMTATTGKESHFTSYDIVAFSWNGRSRVGDLSRKKLFVGDCVMDVKVFG